MDNKIKVLRQTQWFVKDARRKIRIIIYLLVILIVLTIAQLTITHFTI